MASSDVRRLHASYAVHGDESLDRTFPLDDGETILGRGRCRIQRGWCAPVAHYRVSTTRLCLVTHRTIGRDEATAIPRAAVSRVDPPDERGRVTVRLDDETTLVLHLLDRDASTDPFWGGHPSS